MFPLKAVGLKVSHSSSDSFLPSALRGFFFHQKMFIVKRKKKNQNPNQNETNNPTPNPTTVIHPMQMCQTLRSATLVFVFLGFKQLWGEQLHICKSRAGGPNQTLATHNHKAEKSDWFLDSPKMLMSSSFFSFYFSIMQRKNPVQNCWVALPCLHSRNNFHCHKKIFTP